MFPQLVSWQHLGAAALPALRHRCAEFRVGRGIRHPDTALCLSFGPARVSCPLVTAQQTRGMFAAPLRPPMGDDATGVLQICSFWQSIELITDPSLLLSSAANTNTISAVFAARSTFTHLGALRHTFHLRPHLVRGAAVSGSAFAADHRQRCCCAGFRRLPLQPRLSSLHGPARRRLHHSGAPQHGRRHVAGDKLSEIWYGN